MARLLSPRLRYGFEQGRFCVASTIPEALGELEIQSFVSPWRR